MRERVKPAVSVLIGIVFLASTGAGALAPRGEGPRAIVLHVNLDREALELNHSYDEQTVLLNGSVLVDFVYLITVRVTLSVSTDLAWPCSVFPTDMSFVVSAAQPFNATVKVPAGTYNRTAVLTVRGNATVTPGIPGDTAADTATVTVRGDDDGGGNGNGTPPVVPRGRPAPTGVAVPPVPLIMGAVTAGAMAFTAYLLWYRNLEPARKPARKPKGER